MSDEPLSIALEREHREIDAGIETFTSGSDDQRDTAALQRALSALRRHIYLEEEFLFPPLRAAGMMPPVFVMLREHGEMWPTLDALDTALGNGPAGKEVEDLCTTLFAQLQEHNGKEEPIIYPQADTVLTNTARAELSKFIDSAELPDGWVCQNARS